MDSQPKDLSNVHKWFRPTKETIIHPTYLKKLKNQQYQIFGLNSAAKKCLWVHNALYGQGTCYKNTFYGIASHRCIQMTPNLISCPLSCLFCWRVLPEDIQLPSPLKDGAKLTFDDPETIFYGMHWAQRRIVSGYKVVVDKKLFEEAWNPKHVALSLAGEPTFYPHMNELLELIHEHELTSFIVSNGQYPSRIEKIMETPFPSQMYLTVAAPNIRTYNEICRPKNVETAWGRLERSLELVKEMKTRTVVRLTVANTLNLEDAEGYAERIEIGKPNFVEIKGVVHVGGAQSRIERETMPSHEEVKTFGEEIAEHLTGYKLVKEHPRSKVVLLTNGKNPEVVFGEVTN